MAGRKTIVDGVKFHSKLEAEHYKHMKDLKHVKIIELQPVFELIESFKYFNIDRDKTSTYRNMIYTADFLVEIDGVDKPVVVESKGYQRSDYMMRKKLFINKYHEDYHFIQLNNLKECREFFDRYKEE